MPFYRANYNLPTYNFQNFYFTNIIMLECLYKINIKNIFAPTSLLKTRTKLWNDPQSYCYLFKFDRLYFGGKGGGVRQAKSSDFTIKKIVNWEFDLFLTELLVLKLRTVKCFKFIKFAQKNKEKNAEKGDQIG